MIRIAELVRNFDVELIADSIRNTAIPAVEADPDTYVDPIEDVLVYELEDITPLGYQDSGVISDTLGIPPSEMADAENSGYEIDLILEYEKEAADELNEALKPYGLPGWVGFGTYSEGDSSWGLYYFVQFDELLNPAPMPAHRDAWP